MNDENTSSEDRHLAEGNKANKSKRRPKVQSKQADKADEILAYLYEELDVFAELNV